MIFTSLLCRFIGSRINKKWKNHEIFLWTLKLKKVVKEVEIPPPYFFLMIAQGENYIMEQKNTVWSLASEAALGDHKFNEKNIHVTPLPFLQYSPFTEFCVQLALGVFRIFKAPFWQDLSKYTLSNSLAKFIALTLSFTFLYVRKYKFDEW